MRIAWILLCFVGVAAAQQPDYLPLQVGNQWVYYYEGRGEPLVMEVLRSGDFGGNTYYLTRNFLNADTWLRTRDGGTLVAYDPATNRESVLAMFGAAEKTRYATAMDLCSPGAAVVSRNAVAQLPIGQFDNALAIDYSPPICSDAGLLVEKYLPSIGLAQRSRETIAGPRIYDLAYARVSGILVISGPEVGFGISLDGAVYKAGTALAMARLWLRAVQPEALSLTFPTSQEFDLVVTNGAGEEVYRWSNGLAFAQSFHTLSVSGEKNYAVAIPLQDAKGNAFPAGSYTAEAWLTTAGQQAYRARVGFVIRAQ